jgi:hypothetical protein
MACRSYNVTAKDFACHKACMNQSDKPKPSAPSTRQKTPRVPSNVLYDRVVPLALIIMALVLLAVVVVAVAGLTGAIH